MDSTLISARPNEETPSLNRARRAALGSFAGAVVDWYDFLLYGITAALVFNREFFPQISPAMGTLAAFATFGVGFLFRPLGGIIFGHFGDRLGRKRMLMLTVWMMGIATALIGILPSFAAIGWWAPVLLVTLRAVQGFAVGGNGVVQRCYPWRVRLKTRRRSTVAACRWAMAWVCCSLPAWSH
jgi:MFS transporter, MHS family, shikimate and dehydroshikimate transport protein